MSFYAVEIWTGFMIKIPRPGSILNGLGSKFNTSGLNIQRWEMTPRVNIQPGSKYFVTPVHHTKLFNFNENKIDNTQILNEYFQSNCR
jgi:hypothetical protein